MSMVYTLLADDAGASNESECGTKFRAKKVIIAIKYFMLRVTELGLNLWIKSVFPFVKGYIY